MKLHPTLLAAALTLVLGACANDDNADNPAVDPVAADTATATGPAAMPEASVSPGASAGSLADADRRALLAVQEVDRHEIAAAEDALARNVQGEVRAYAETLRDDHGRNLEATRALLGGVAGEADDGQHYAENAPRRDIAGAADVQPAGADHATHTPEGDAATDPPELAAMRDRHEAERRRLAALEGGEFSREWIAAMVKGHEEALARLDGELIPGATDAAVTQHLQSTRAAISRHLDTARSLQGAR